MTQQEQQLLSGLIGRVNGTQLQSKDAEAEQLLNSSLERNPDALYVLCQTVLVQQFALEKSQRDLQTLRAENDGLKQQAGKPQEHGSFLGNLFGLNKSDGAEQQKTTLPASYTGPAASPNTPGYTAVQNRTNSPYGYNPQYPMQPGYGNYGQPATSYATPASGGVFGGGGGFLQGAMQTAAGVVAGEFAFHAIEDVFSGFGHGGGRGFEGGNETVNNYFDGSDSRQNGGLADRLQASDGLGNGISPDVEDRRGDSSGFLGGDDGTNDSSSFAGDDTSNDDSSSFTYDSGSYDDGGGSSDSGSDDSNY